MIKTTMQKAFDAFITLSRMRNKVKGKDALYLFHMKNMLKEPVDFQNEEEVKLVEEHGGTITDNGTIIIADAEKRTAYQKARKELGEMECEVHTDPVKVSLERNPDITMEEIELLDGFVEFE